MSSATGPKARALALEVARRRTFAIISHPDAGKTTLTEKFLLYGGALQLAGSVTARKNQRATTSDWMELERQRGISVSSTVLQFDYHDSVINLLDTPGHRDFSEDTYRVLTAVDAAVMVIDAAKGIEPQTQKLFEICRRRAIPIFTFINKLDRPSRDPLDLLDELESTLGLHAFPLNWPLGHGPTFKGIFDRRSSQVHLFERTPHGAYQAPVKVSDIHDPTVRDVMDAASYAQACDELELLDGAGADFKLEDVHSGSLTPVFFGSAMNNFGVQLLLDGFLSLAPPPAPRLTPAGPLSPETPSFSGFIFKIQANMNPRHRDYIAFLRVVSGTFQRDMAVAHPRSGRTIRLGNSQRLFAQDRETVDEAYAGDVVGLVGNYDFQIGDTLAEDPEVAFDEMPRFAPESFSYLYNSSTADHKRFRQGLTQLLKEGVAQYYELPDAATKVALIGAVGPLQFEVLQYRLESEYGATTRLEPAPWEAIRWIVERTPASPPAPNSPQPRPADVQLPTGGALALDAFGCWAALLPTAWSARFFAESNPHLIISADPPSPASTPAPAK